MRTIFVNCYAAADVTEATQRAVTVDELGDRLGLSDVERNNLRHNCERHGRHQITADMFVTITADMFVTIWNNRL